MCIAGQRLSLTITGPGPSFLKYQNLGRGADPKGTMSYWTEGGIFVRPSERTNEQTNEWTNKQMNEQTKERTNKRMNKQMNEQTNEQTLPLINIDEDIKLSLN